MLKITKAIRDEFDIENLCLAGGVALNCVAMEKFITKDIQKIWIQPAAGDAGGSLGAALALWYDDPVNIRQVNKKDDMQGSYLGPENDQEIIEKELKTLGANYKILSDEQIIRENCSKFSR